MGCPQCRGHAGQVCGAPGCHDESAEVEAELRRAQARPRLPVLVCGHCGDRLLSAGDGSWICLRHGVQGRGATR
jgi:hypothetical protein